MKTFSQQCNPEFIIMPLNDLEVYDHKTGQEMKHETALWPGMGTGELIFSASSTGSLPKSMGPLLANIPDAQLECHHSAGRVSNCS